jgi:hypothetical protein
MEIILGGRRHGKTTKALEWLAQARRLDTYPFWDRVLLVPGLDEAQHIRTRLRREAEERGEVDASLYYYLVYCFEEWSTAMLGRQPVHVYIDRAEVLFYQMLQRATRYKAQVDGFTFNIDEDDELIVLPAPPSWEDIVDAQRKS